MSDLIEVLRKEKKYIMDTAQIIETGIKLDGVLNKDKNCLKGGYMVRSLYFDTVDDRDFAEKAAGVEVRSKIRLRIYSPQDKVAKLEYKQKEGEFQRKRSLNIDKEDANALIKGQYEVLNKYNNKLAQELYVKMSRECYIPKCIVEYNRVAYTVMTNDIRITFDTDIKATEASFDLFSEKLNLYPASYSPLNILEVKYNRFLFSYIIDILEYVDKAQTSASKYCMARGVSCAII